MWQVETRTASRTRVRRSNSSRASGICITSRCVRLGNGVESPGADAATTATAAALPRARDGRRFDLATALTHLVRDFHRAGNRWSVQPANRSMGDHSGKYLAISLCASLCASCVHRVCLSRSAAGGDGIRASIAADGGGKASCAPMKSRTPISCNHVTFLIGFSRPSHAKTLDTTYTKQGQHLQPACADR